MCENCSSDIECRYYALGFRFCSIKCAEAFRSKNVKVESPNQFCVISHYHSPSQNTVDILGFFDTKELAVDYVVTYHLKHYGPNTSRLYDFLFKNILSLSEDDHFESYGLYDVNVEHFGSFQQQNEVNSREGTLFEKIYIKSCLSTQ